jgi:hypothetical protein
MRKACSPNSWSQILGFYPFSRSPKCVARREAGGFSLPCDSSDGDNWPPSQAMPLKGSEAHQNNPLGLNYFYISSQNQIIFPQNIINFGRIEQICYCYNYCIVLHYKDKFLTLSYFVGLVNKLNMINVWINTNHLADL